MKQHVLDWPADKHCLSQLKSGDVVFFSGTVYTARDTAHHRLVTLMHENKPLPLDLTDAAIFYAGPAACPPGRASGSIGPTTSVRMDVFKEDMMKAGMKVMIGKGACGPQLSGLCQRYGAVYLAALGGVAALTARCIISAETVAWEDLGAESLKRLQVKDLPLVVINDIYGHDYYTQINGE